MSDILNHYHCAREAFTRLPEENPLTQIIMDNYDAFRLGTQGPDFLYYDILDMRTKSARLSAKAIHTSHVDDFFCYGLQFAQEYPEFRDVTLAYLCGFASHHALDTLTHPFIFYRSGKNDGSDPNKQIYSHLHKLYEVLLDTAMMQYEYATQAVFEGPEKVFIVSPFTLRFLEEFYAYVLPKAFGIKLSKNTVARALKTAVRILSHFKDPTGRRKRIVKRLEKLVKQDHALSCLYYPLYTNEFNILNIANNTWKNPVTGEEHDESYPQLYHQAVDQSLEHFNALYQLWESGQIHPHKVSELFKNRSYLSGLRVEDEREAQYFDDAFIERLQREF